MRRVNIVNRAYRSVALAAVLVALTVAAPRARADDSMSRATPSKQQLMKDCIEKQKTADVTMSKSQMKRMCRDQLKEQKASGTPPEAPVTEPNHN